MALYVVVDVVVSTLLNSRTFSYILETIRYWVIECFRIPLLSSISFAYIYNHIPLFYCENIHSIENARSFFCSVSYAQNWICQQSTVHDFETENLQSSLIQSNVVYMVGLKLKSVLCTCQHHLLLSSWFESIADRREVRRREKMSSCLHFLS